MSNITYIFSLCRTDEVPWAGFMLVFSVAVAVLNMGRPGVTGSARKSGDAALRRDQFLQRRARHALEASIRDG